MFVQAHSMENLLSSEVRRTVLSGREGLHCEGGLLDNQGEAAGEPISGSPVSLFAPS